MVNVEIDGRHFEGAVHLVTGTECEPRQKHRKRTNNGLEADIQQTLLLCWFRLAKLIRAHHFRRALINYLR